MRSRTRPWAASVLPPAVGAHDAACGHGLDGCLVHGPAASAAEARCHDAPPPTSARRPSLSGPLSQQDLWLRFVEGAVLLWTQVEPRPALMVPVRVVLVNEGEDVDPFAREQPRRDFHVSRVTPSTTASRTSSPACCASRSGWSPPRRSPAPAHGCASRRCPRCDGEANPDRKTQLRPESWWNPCPVQLHV